MIGLEKSIINFDGRFEKQLTYCLTNKLLIFDVSYFRHISKGPNNELGLATLKLTNKLINQFAKIF